MKNLPKEKAQIGELTKLLFPEDFLANPIQQAEKEKAKKIPAIYGPKCCEQLKKFNRIGLWARMFTDLLIGTEEWYSTKSRLSWKIKATKYNRIYFQLVAKTHRTKDTEFSLLPTATTVQQNTKFQQGGSSLQYLAINDLLPTPLAVERTHTERVLKLKKTGAQSVFSTKNGTTRPNGIVDFLMFYDLIPTPTAQEGGKITGKENQNSLTKMARVTTGKTGQLNHRFVAELMGFPTNWTELPFQNLETKV
jgi:hypothetical protein